MKDEFLERYQPLYELANIGGTSGLVVKVHGSDHGIPNFHIIRKDEFLVEIQIPQTAKEELHILGYKLHKRDIRRSELKKISAWLDEPFSKNAKITNLEQIWIQWEILEPT